MSPEARHQLEAVLERHGEITVAYLFGSAARNDESSLSDIDVGVLWGEESAHSLLARARLSEELARAAHGVPVDVVPLDEAPPAIAGRIVREGRVLLCRDEERRIRFEIHALDRDMDTVHLRRLYDETLARAIREGRFYG